MTPLCNHAQPVRGCHHCYSRQRTDAPAACRDGSLGALPLTRICWCDAPTACRDNCPGAAMRALTLPRLSPELHVALLELGSSVHALHNFQRAPNPRPPTYFAQLSDALTRRDHAAARVIALHLKLTP